MPSFVYAIAFIPLLLIYQIGWSDMYPELHGFLLWFLIGSSLFAIFLGVYQARTLRIPITPINLSEKFIKRSFYIIIIGYILDFAFEMTIPLFRTFYDSNFSYDDFTGIPTIHVILSTFSIFFSILMFDVYMCNKKRKSLVLFLSSLIPYLLVLNRGAFMIVFCAIIFIYLIRTKNVKIRNLFKSIFIIGVVLYFFGLIGNIRQTQTKSDGEFVLRIAGATDKFLNSGVPAEFYWSYIYVTSPVGNLQNIIDKKQDEFDEKKLGLFISSELLPDFLSKRVSALLGYDKILARNYGSRYLVTINLNAPTTYYNAYLNLGSSGMYIMFFAIMFSALFYPKVLNKKQPFYITGIASLNSIILLSMFNNMWFNTGTILLWPIIIGIGSRLTIK